LTRITEVLWVGKEGGDAGVSVSVVKDDVADKFEHPVTSHAPKSPRKIAVGILLKHVA